MGLDENKLIHWLQELISIPSVTGNEEEISRYVGQELSKMGYQPSVKENNGFFEVGEGSKSLLLNAHLDTVDVLGDWKYDPFGATKEDGKIFGRGASDDKGNIAAMLEIARMVKNMPINGRLIFTFTTGEEFGAKLEAKGSYLLSQFLKADKALVLEPQTDIKERRVHVIYGCRGIEDFVVRIQGKASHTGYPERGNNAISMASQVLAKLKETDFHKVHVEDQDIQTICMPLRINGGADIYRVPDECELRIHCRTAPYDTKIGQQIELVCKEICGKNFSIQSSYSAPGYVEDPSDELVDIIHKQAQLHNYIPLNRFAGGRIDASIFSSFGNIPAFCMGVGDRDQMHLVDEYITVEEFIACSKLLMDVVLTYLI